MKEENFYCEKILHLLISGGFYRLDKCFQCIHIIMTKEECKDFFNINDIHLLIDVTIKSINTEKNTDTREWILRVIEDILSSETYKEFPHKKEDVEETITNLILLEEDDCGYSFREREVISRINLKMQMEKLK